MGKFSGTKIAENRQYENPSDPANSNFTVIFEVTAPEAVIDPATGKKLSETISEHATEIAAGIAAAKAAADKAAEAQTTASNAQAAASAASSSSTPTAFSVDTAVWKALAEPVTDCSYSAEIAASGVTASDIPDVYFDDATILAASTAEIRVGFGKNKLIFYAKKTPTTALSGVYFTRKAAKQ